MLCYVKLDEFHNKLNLAAPSWCSERLQPASKEIFMDNPNNGVLNQINNPNHYAFCDYLFSLLEKAKNSLIFDFESAVLQNLTMPSKLIISALWNMESRKTSTIKFHNVLSEIGVINRIAGRGITSFSEKILKEALHQLYDIGFINADKIPVTHETVLVLKVNPLKIQKCFKRGDDPFEFLFREKS